MCIAHTALSAPSPCKKLPQSNGWPSSIGEKPASELTPSLLPLKGVERERLVEEYFEAGFFPKSQFAFKPVTIKKRFQSEVLSITYFVAPDYLALGTDADAVRFPITNIVAQRLADRHDLTFLTRKMADQVFCSADRLALSPAYSVDREATYQFLRHNSAINKKLGQPFGQDLVAGFKKDVVMGQVRPKRVKIYGWAAELGCVSGGIPFIQPETDIHKAHYVDYSHGVRLVSTKAWLKTTIAKGQTTCRETFLAELLQNERTCRMLADPSQCPFPLGTDKSYFEN